MLQFILINIFMVSVGTILFIMVRALPRTGEESSEIKLGILDRWVASEIPEKLDQALNSFLEKFLRKTHVWTLKFDNFISHSLKKVKPNGNGAKGGYDFKDIASNGDESESK